MIHLDYRDSRPIYEQVKDGLRRLMVTGVLASGDKLPSVRAMASQLSINPNTIQRAYAELEAEGRAAILIPSPNVAENHQYYNAMELQKAGAAVVIEEKDLTGEKLVSTVSDMLAQPGKLAEMGKNARSYYERHFRKDLFMDKLEETLNEYARKGIN